MPTFKFAPKGTPKGGVKLPAGPLSHRPTQSNRQLDSHPAIPPNQISNWTYTQPSHPIKLPAGLTPSHPTQSNRQLDLHPAIPPNKTASWTHTQPFQPI
jgi:hypothetical protein